MSPQEIKLVEECENEFDWELHQNYNDHTCMPLYVDCYDSREVWDPDAMKTRTYHKTKIEFIRGQSWLSNGKELDQYLKDEHVAEKLIAKWFNQSPNKVDGSYYNMDLIQERGAYDASQLDLLRSQESIRGENILKDAGMDLIPNTFVVCARFSFRKHNGFNTDRDVHGEKRYYVYYTVYAHTYLYKLEWTEKESNLFMSKYYFSEPEKLLSSNDFNLKYIDEYKDSIIHTEVKSQKDMERGRHMLFAWTGNVVKNSIYKVMHRNMVVLQARNENFGIKAPLIDVDIKKKYATAFIGTKEGIGYYDRFEVLMPQYDEKNNVFRNVRVGVLQVDPKRIWDNAQNNSHQEIDRTYFKGANKDIKKMAPGMILNQIAFTLK
jgi:hypothetical protein